MHVHIAPDVVERRIDDVALARRFEELGLAGFVLKSHYTSTAERAAVVRGVVPGSRALGAIVLNRAVGGMNPLAVEIAAREGARVVWMPTVGLARRARAPRPPAARARTCRCGRRLEAELRERGHRERAGRRRSTTTARCCPRRARVLEVVAEHGLVLATGHLGRDEVFAVVDAARRGGRASTSWSPTPTSPPRTSRSTSSSSSPTAARWIERCFTTPHTGKCSWEQWLEGTRAVGAERTLLSSDLGQVQNPPVEDGLALMADRLLDAGFGEDEVRTMAVTNTSRIAGSL